MFQMFNVVEEDVRQWYETCKKAANDTTIGATRVEDRW